MKVSIKASAQELNVTLLGSVVKINLEVTKEQVPILDSQSKIANWLYNKLLEHAKALRK